MGDDMPRDAQGLTGCKWCGGPVQQPATGRRRDYCNRTHRELAYRARKTDGRVTDALQWDESTAAAWLALHGAPAPVRQPVDVPDPSVVESRPAPDTSVVETRAVPPLPRPSRRRRSMTASPMPLLPSYDNDDSGIA